MGRFHVPRRLNETEPTVEPVAAIRPRSNRQQIEVRAAAGNQFLNQRAANATAAMRRRNVQPPNAPDSLVLCEWIAVQPTHGNQILPKRAQQCLSGRIESIGAGDPVVEEPLQVAEALGQGFFEQPLEASDWYRGEDAELNCHGPFTHP